MRWDLQIHNKLHKINPEVKKHYSGLRNRRSNCVLTRLRIGHTRLTHSYLMEGKDPPKCQFCPNQDLTVEHILIFCSHFTGLRYSYYRVNSLKDLFENVHSLVIIDFIRAAGLFNKL